MFKWLVGRPAARETFSVISGEVVSRDLGQQMEDKSCAGPDFEIVGIKKGNGDTVLCAQFSDQAGYGRADKGSRVEVKISSGLDPWDFGTPHKVETIRVLTAG